MFYHWIKMVKVNVTHGKNKFDVEVNAGDAFELFQAQLYSLSGVPPERQKIILKGKAIKSTADMAALTEGAKLMLMGSADSLPQAPTKAVVFEEDLTAMQRAKIAPGSFKVGLKNLGNTCYMNSSLQCLRAIPEFKQALSSVGRPARSDDLGAALTFSLGSLFKDMDGSSDAVTPMMFVSLLRSTFPQFDEKDDSGFHMQQDADECLFQLLSAVARASNKGDAKAAEQTANNIVDEGFGGTMQQVMRCAETDAEPERVTVESFRKLRCYIDANTNHMHEGILKTLEETVELRSSVLARQAQFVKKSVITRLPRNLIVQFVRFDWNAIDKVKRKITRKVTFPEKMDVMAFCDPQLRSSLGHARRKVKEIEDKKLGLAPSTTSSSSSSSSSSSAAAAPAPQPVAPAKPEPMKDDTTPASTEQKDKKEIDLLAPQKIGTTGFYELMAVVTHQGRSADSGHYVGWSRKAPGSDDWLKFDDHIVSECTTEDIKKLYGGQGDWHTAYICFYRRLDDVTDESVLGL